MTGKFASLPFLLPSLPRRFHSALYSSLSFSLSTISPRGNYVSEKLPRSQFSKVPPPFFFSHRHKQFWPRTRPQRSAGPPAWMWLEAIFLDPVPLFACFRAPEKTCAAELSLTELNFSIAETNANCSFRLLFMSCVYLILGPEHSPKKSSSVTLSSHFVRTPLSYKIYSIFLRVYTVRCVSPKKSLVKLQAAVVQYGPYVRYVSVEKQRSFAMHVAKVKHFFF